MRRVEFCIKQAAALYIRAEDAGYRQTADGSMEDPGVELLGQASEMHDRANELWIEAGALEGMPDHIAMYCFGANSDGIRVDEQVMTEMRRR